MRPIHVRIDELKEKLLDPKILTNQGLGNEVGFYIFDYEPEEELIVRNSLPAVKKYVERESREVKIQVFDLYDIVIDFFESKGYMDKNFKLEEKRGSYALFDTMQRALRLATNQDWIVRYIRENMDGNAIIFLTGVGKVFPIVRSHSILNNLQTVVEKQPLIMFYPGKYEEGSLKLFSLFKDDNYYRAFKIIED